MPSRVKRAAGGRPAASWRRSSSAWRVKARTGAEICVVVTRWFRSADPPGSRTRSSLARAEPNGFSLAAGELVSARSAGVQALFIPALVPGGVDGEFEDLNEESVPAGGPARCGCGSGGSRSWAAQAAQAASEQQVDEEPEEQAEPELRGDLVHHFAFGWCEV